MSIYLFLNKVFKKQVESLYLIIIILGVVGSFVIVILQFLSANYDELNLSIAAFAVSCVCLSLFYSGYKSISYHLIVPTFCALYLYMTILKGARYEAILLMYPASLLFCFVVFEKTKTLVYYLVFLIINQLIITYYYTDAHIYGLNGQVVAEFINIIFYNIVIFLLAKFYYINLKNTKVDLIKAVEFQAILKENNDTLKKYIESNVKLENYASLAAHELKAPLRAINSFSNILHKKIQHQLDEDDKEMFDIITSSTIRMSTLVDDIRDLSKVAQTEIVLETFNIEEIIEDIKIHHHSEIIEKNAEIILSNSIKEVKGHKNLIRQLFSNIIGNSLKFTQKEIPPIIKIILNRVSGFNELKIMDNGIGIEADQRENVFQIFSRLNSKFEYEGSGIGLAICKKIVDLHKGTISVEDSELGGICFKIKLPVTTS